MQQNIDFGTFPNDPDADAIRTAFQKVQNNFSQLFNVTTDYAVVSVNQVAGDGITVNQPTGNVVISANIACLQVYTTSLKVGKVNDNTATSTTITQSYQKLNIDIDPDHVYSNYFGASSNSLASISGTLTAISNAQPNITSIGTLSSLNVIGNVVAGNLRTAGDILGNNFIANGNITITGNTSMVNINTGNIVASGTLAVTGNANVGNLGTTNIVVSGNANVGTLNATTISGTLSTASQPNITSIGTLTSLNVNGTITAVAFTANTGVFTGNGSALTNLNGSNVTGTVANATYAVTSGTAYAVSGANVSGAVAYATTANAVAGANVSGAVAYATTANAVAGANVSGAVAYATTANAVAGANVSGAVAYATTANAVSGANVSGTVANATYATSAGIANSVSGGNISGAVEFAAVANSVAGANVSGAVAYATVANSVAGANVSGSVIYATIANSVAGANVSGTVANATYAVTSGTSYSVAGANVSGAVTYAATANAVAGANVSGEVANAAYATTANTAYFINGKMSGTLDVNGFAITGGAFSYSKVEVGIPGGYNALNLKALNSNVLIQTGINGTATANWVFDTAGNLTLPANAFSINYANGSSAVIATSANANYANYAGTAYNVDGANVSGAVAYSTVANSVTGANVSGTVANATYSVTSGSTNSVTGANVSGTVANATYATSAGTAVTAGTVTTNAQPNITSVGTLTSLNANGTITAVAFTANTGVFTGNGSGLTNLNGANVTGTVANATYALTTGSSGAATTAATVTTNAQPNITSVGTLTTLNVSGNISGNVNGYSIGYRDIPQITLTGNTTLALTDTGKHYYSANTTYTVTVPTNSAVPFNIGAAITFVQEGAQAITFTPAAGVTMYLAGNSTSANRSLTNYGMATLMKVGTNIWFINGTGLT